jgi:hypothetical protein
MAGGVSTELVDALMVTLGSRFESLSGKDVQAIKDLCTTTPSMMTTADTVDVMITS